MTHAPDRTPGSKANILLVDDQPANLLTLEAVLQDLGQNLIQARSGEEALRHLLRTDFAVILLDVRMPGLNGFETAQLIRGRDRSRHTPIIFLTAFDRDDFPVAKAYALGAVDYIVKPFVPEILRAKVSVFVELSQLRAKQEAAQRQRWRVTLASIGDAVIVTDSQGRVTFLNAVAEGLTGWTEDEALGRALEDVFSVLDEGTRRPIENPVARVRREGTVVGIGNRGLLRARHGIERPIDDSAAPIRDEQGNLSGVVLVFRDVTERRQAEEMLRQRAAELAQNNRRKDEFLAMLGHELRNPLAPLRNAVQVLRLKGADPEVLPQIQDMIERQVGQLARLVDDLLDMSRINQGKIELRKEPADLAAVVARAADSARPLVEERGHRMEVSLPGRPLPVLADPARLEQVLTNLLHNSAKYTPPGGRVWVEAGEEGGRAVVRVRDNGIGIRAELLPYIFELFQQADSVPGRVREGLGIGLTLVHRLVQMHGGSVEAHSEGPGKGSEFVVRLPLASDATLPGPHDAPALTPPEGAAAPAANGPAGRSGRPLAVLVVDDNRDAAESLSLLLQLGGHRVRAVHDGPAALQAAGAAAPDVVLLDIGLPKGMTGYEVARQLRQLPGLGGALLVAMTGYGQEEDRRRSREAGFDAHLVKPVDPDALRELLTQWQTTKVV